MILLTIVLTGAAHAGDPTFPDPIARVGGEPIPLQQLDADPEGSILRANIALYEARRDELDHLIDERLLDGEAKKRGLTREALVQQEIIAKVVITDADVQAFFDANKSRMSGTFEDMKPRIRDHLQDLGQEAAEDELLSTLRAAAHVEVFLPPVRVPVVSDGYPRIGSSAAPVQIVEFSDFQCPYCRRAADTMAQVVTKYGDKVSLVFRNDPLPMHAYAHRAAEAADCANDQGRFWTYHDLLFAGSKLDDTQLEGYATTLGLQASKFDACLHAGAHTAEVDADMADAARAAITGTPGFFINGRPISGAQPLGAFSAIIDEELATAGKAPPAPTGAPHAGGGVAPDAVALTSPWREFRLPANGLVMRSDAVACTIAWHDGTPEELRQKVAGAIVARGYKETVAGIQDGPWTGVYAKGKDTVEVTVVSGVSGNTVWLTHR